MSNTGIRNKTRIIFRADGNSRIGLGHVVRSLALVQMLRQEYECVFAIQVPDKDLLAQLQRVCHGIIQLPACLPDQERFTHELSAYIAPDVLVVLDGYQFDTAYQAQIKAKGCGLVCVDDIHAFPFTADVVLNQAGGVEASAYRTAPYSKLLLGPKYALLRQPFLKAAQEARLLPPGSLRVLLNMGGADPHNYTLQVAQAIAGAVTTVSVEIVVGSAYKHKEDLQQWVSRQASATLHQDLDAAAMRQLMQECSLAITSASGVAYEYAAVGGLLFVLQTADNQRALYQFLVSAAVALPYEQFFGVVKRCIQQPFRDQVQVQRQYFDGKSDARLRQVFATLRMAAALNLRSATEADMELIYHWNNDPAVRTRSFNPDPIPIESHKAWFISKLADPDCILYLASVENEPAAQIRFQVQESKATISYLISEGYRGKGLGHRVLLKGIEELLKQRPQVTEIEGLVKSDNIASVRAFEKAGFTNGSAAPQHPEAHRFVLTLGHQ